MTRRTALALLGGTTAALAVGGVGCVAGDPWPRISAIGRTYMQMNPAEADAATLAAVLGGVNPTATPPTLLAQLDADITGDFVAGRVVWLAGWQLSRTEARIAALWAAKGSTATQT